METFSEKWGGFFLKTPRNLSMCLAVSHAHPWTNNGDWGWIRHEAQGLRVGDRVSFLQNQQWRTEVIA